jgi:hypothetical protein
VMPLRLAIAGIEVLAKPSVAKRCIAELTMRSRVVAGAEVVTIRCAASARAGSLRAVFALAFFTFTFSRPCQIRRIPALIQGLADLMTGAGISGKRYQRRVLHRRIDSV